MLGDRWPIGRLGDCAYIKGRIGWRGLTASEYTNDGPYLIAGKHLVAGKVNWSICDHISMYRYLESSEIALRDGDVILTKDGTIGRVAIINRLPGLATINSTMMLIRVRLPLLPQYVYHYLTGDAFQKLVADKVSGSSIPHIFQRDLAELAIPIPSEVEQRRIAEILDTADAAIQQSETLIAKLKQMKAGLLHDLLTRGLDAHGQLRDPVAHPEQFKDSPVGRIPKEWEIRSIIELGRYQRLTVQTGPFGAQLHAEDYVEEGIPFILIKNIKQEGFDETDMPHITREDAKRLVLYALEPGDIVFSRVGRVGSCFLAEEQHCGYVISGQLLRIRLPADSIDRRYLLHALRSKPAQDWITGTSVGTTRQSTNTQILEALRVPVPGREEQYHIAAILDAQDALIRAEEAHLNKLKLVKRGLMADLLTGRVRVSGKG